MDDRVIKYLIKRKTDLEKEVNFYRGTKARATYELKLNELNEVKGLLITLNVITFDMLIEGE